MRTVDSLKIPLKVKLDFGDWKMELYENETERLTLIAHNCDKPNIITTAAVIKDHMCWLCEENAPLELISTVDLIKITGILRTKSTRNI